MPVANPVRATKGILLVDKPEGMNAFKLVAILRRRLGVKKIGHAGTLDPFATGVMVMLVGRDYTRLSDTFLTADKEYAARIRLGVETDSYDKDGAVVSESDAVPTLEEVEAAVAQFQGKVLQTPPMYSAKKVNGKKLYELARQGKEIERKPVEVTLDTQLVSYDYPYIDITVACSKGTYIRSIAYDMGKMLGCGAHLEALVRTRSGDYRIDQCIAGDSLLDDDFAVAAHLRQDDA